MRRLLAISALLAAGCFEPWPVNGPYRCGAGACPDNMVCDDGVCCFPDKAPICRSLVLDGGTCFNGATPQAYFEDKDEDGFGNKNSSRLYCAAPVSDHFVSDNTDCDDLKKEVNPLETESCDGFDNDCDGVIDDGLTPLKTVFADTDNDGYGDPAISITVCATPAGYVDNNQDCGPTDPNRHPNADELCNGLDDDCDGVIDESPINLNQPCGDAGFGECANGTTACVAGNVVCTSTNVPVPDVCDGLDNNCNGRVDEQPECGGPRYLLGPGINVAAQNLRVTVPFPPPATCLKNYGTMYTGDSWAPPTWAGTSSYSHVWWAEAPGTTTWDLSKPGTALHVNFGYTQLNGDPAGGWSGANWPVIYLCDPTGTSFNRYVPSGTGLMGPGASGTVNSMMPIAGGSGWTVGIGSGFDIKKVKRLEIYVKPDYYQVVTGPSFTVTFRPDAGFVTR